MRGQSLVEFVLVFPVFILIGAVTVELGVMGFQQIRLQTSAQQILRRIKAGQQPSPNGSSQFTIRTSLVSTSAPAHSLRQKRAVYVIDVDMEKPFHFYSPPLRLLFRSAPFLLKAKAVGLTVKYE